MCWKSQALKVMQWLLLLQLSDNWSSGKVIRMPNFASNVIAKYFYLARAQSHHDPYDYCYFYRQVRDIDDRKSSAFRLFVQSTSIGKENSLLGVNINLRPQSVRILKCLSVRAHQSHLRNMNNCHDLQQHNQKRSCFWRSLIKLAHKMTFSSENAIPKTKNKRVILGMNLKNFRLQLIHSYTKPEKPMRVHNKQYPNFHSEISPLESIFLIGVIDRLIPNKYFMKNLTHLLNMLKPFQPASNLSAFINFGGLPIKKIRKVLNVKKEGELMITERALLHKNKNKIADMNVQFPVANEKVKSLNEFEGNSFSLTCHPFTFLFDSQDYRKNVRCSEKSFPEKYTRNSANMRYKSDHFGDVGSTNNTLFFQGFFPIENDTNEWSSKNPKINFENTMFLPAVEEKARKVSNRSPDLTVLLPISHEMEDTYYKRSRITLDNNYAPGIKENVKESHPSKDELTDANVIITSKDKNESRSRQRNRRSSRRWKKSAIASTELAHNDTPDIKLFTGYSRPMHVKEHNNANTILSPAYNFMKSENFYEHSLANFLYKLFKNNSLSLDQLDNHRSNTEIQGNRASENFNANVDEELSVPAKMDAARVSNFKDKLKRENDRDEFEHMYESIESTVGDIDYSTSDYNVTKAFNEFEYIDDGIDVDINPDQADDNFKEIGAYT